jgi:integrase
MLEHPAPGQSMKVIDMSENSNTKSVNKGGRKPKGTIQRTKDGRWRARITLVDGTRKWLPPFAAGTSESMAREKAAALNEKARTMGIKSTTAPKLDRRAMVAQAKTSCDGWVDLWLAERDRKGLSSRVTKEGHWKHHIAPVLGTKHPKQWKRDDFRALSAALDDKVQGSLIAWKTAVDVWGTAIKMVNDATNSKRNEIRCRDDNPADGVVGPDRGDEVDKQYLYPSEVEQLLSCPQVSIPWARLFAIAIYTYCRASELRALTWDDVDLEHGVIRITKSVQLGTEELKGTKSGHSRTIPIELGLRPLLIEMHTEAGGKGPVIPAMPSGFNLSAGLKRWLATANVDRPALTSKGPSERPIRFHDLRATGLTWMAVRGDEPQKIQARAGHTEFKTTQLYIRQAEVHGDGFGEPFAPLPARLVERFVYGVSSTAEESSNETAGILRPQRAQRVLDRSQHWDRSWSFSPYLRFAKWRESSRLWPN